MQNLHLYFYCHITIHVSDASEVLHFGHRALSLYMLSVNGPMGLMAQILPVIFSWNIDQFWKKREEAISFPYRVCCLLVFPILVLAFKTFI